MLSRQLGQQQPAASLRDAGQAAKVLELDAREQVRRHRGEAAQLHAELHDQGEDPSIHEVAGTGVHHR